jgi:lipopolysaccharide transport system permease protein
VKDFSASPSALISSFRTNFQLIKSLTKREIYGRYRGSFFGVLWSLINPLFMLLIYTFVFGVVFKSRWAGGGESKSEFALVLFSGLMVFNLFSECIVRSPRLIIDNANFVKKVIFPLEVLSVVSLLTSVFHFLVSLFIWLITYTLVFGQLNITALAVPLIIIPLFLMTLGFSWILNSLGTYFRDLQQIIGPLVMSLMFLSPIFYSISSIPKGYQYLVYINPLATIIESFRGALYFGSIPNLTFLLFYYIGSLLILILGFWFFQKTRKGFADVL